MLGLVILGVGGPVALLVTRGVMTLLVVRQAAGAGYRDVDLSLSGTSMDVKLGDRAPPAGGDSDQPSSVDSVEVGDHQGDEAHGSDDDSLHGPP